MDELGHLMRSPLRLALVDTLLRAAEKPLHLEKLVLASASYAQDVEACLAPLVAQAIVERREPGPVFRISRGLDAPRLTRLRQIASERAAVLAGFHRMREGLAGMFGADPKMQLVFQMVRQVAKIDAAVLITGETGTGKELIARAVHDLSPRRDGFFGAVNCATLLETLFESEVFGHVRGAFTGAIRDRVGLVQRCHGGTLFLDEVGDLSPANQVKLLRVLQERSFSRLGETSLRHSDFRLVAATNRDLTTMAADGRFREDLLYRINVFPIRVPSLRERPADLPHLVNHILASHGRRFQQNSRPTMTGRALEQLRAYRWPGNVRELENVVARAAIMAGERPIDVDHLPDLDFDAIQPSRATRGAAPAWQRSLAEVDKEHLVRVLRQCRGNLSQAATVLGISRPTLYRKIKLFRVDIWEEGSPA
jgi:two-component system response regulator HydG